jgi:tyrosine-protein phosphatase SIW14
VRFTSTLTRACSTALLVAFSFAVPAAGQTRSTSPRPDVVDFSKIRIDNFGAINPVYYRGGQPKGGDYDDLAALGVTTVVNLTSTDTDPSEEPMVKRAGMKYVHIPMTTHEPPTSAELAEFLAVVSDPANQPVYVHCVGGRHRTGVMTAAYRMTRDGWSADQAFAEMKHYKFGADFLHPEFKQFVYGYRATLAQTAPAETPAAAKPGGR